MPDQQWIHEVKRIYNEALTCAKHAGREEVTAADVWMQQDIETARQQSARTRVSPLNKPSDGIELGIIKKPD